MHQTVLPLSVVGVSSFPAEGSYCFLIKAELAHVLRIKSAGGLRKSPPYLVTVVPGEGAHAVLHAILGLALIGGAPCHHFFVSSIAFTSHPLCCLAVSLVQALWLPGAEQRSEVPTRKKQKLGLHFPSHLITLPLSRRIITSGRD